MATNALVTVTTVNECFKAMKLAYFVNRSTITMMIVFPLDGGNPSTKSIEISIYIRVGLAMVAVTKQVLYNQFYTIDKYRTATKILSLINAY